MSVSDIGKLVIVCVCGLGGTFCTFSALKFGQRLLKEKEERFEGFGFIMIGLIMFGVIVGLSMIAVEKGL